MRFCLICAAAAVLLALEPGLLTGQDSSRQAINDRNSQPVWLTENSDSLDAVAPVSHEAPLFEGGSRVPPTQPDWLENLGDWWNRAYYGVHTEAAYIGDADGVSLAEWDLNTTVLTLPVPGGPPPMLIPSFGIDYFRLPDSLGVPSELYSTSLELNWIRPVRKDLTLNLAVAPRLNTDFQVADSRAWGVTGRVLGFFSWGENLQVALGAVFLGRDDIPVLPGVGVIWNPDPRWQLNLMIPRPRIAWRWFERGETAHWLYVGGQLGGNTWAFERPDGSEDVMNYRDLRLLVGWELNRGGHPGAKHRKRILRIETGYVFARQVEIEDALTEFEPGSTWLIRADINY